MLNTPGRDQEISLKFVEVRESLAEIAEDQKAPMIADFIDGAGDRAKVCVGIFFHKMFRDNGFRQSDTTHKVVHIYFGVNSDFPID